MRFIVTNTPELFYRRPCHVKWDGLVEALKRLNPGSGLIVDGFTEDIKTVQMRVRGTINKRVGPAKNFRVLKSDNRILIERISE